MATNGTAKQPRSKRRKDTLRYYNQSDWMRPTGLGAIIAAVVLFYFGWTYVSYILDSLLMPGGLFLFFYASVRHTSDADVEKERETLLRDFDSSVTGAEDYRRLDCRWRRAVFPPHTRRKRYLRPFCPLASVLHPRRVAGLCT